MTQSRLARITLILAIVALSMYIAERLWQLGAALGNIVSVIAVSWLLSLIVRPFINYLRGGLVPPVGTRWVRRRYGELAAQRVARLRLPLAAAVTIVYIALLFLLIGGITFATASILPQALELLQRLPTVGADLPNYLTQLWLTTAPRLGLDATAFDINKFVSIPDLSARAAELAGLIASQAVNLAATAAGAVGQVFLILVLSLYFVVEDKLVERQLFAALPGRFHETARLIGNGINRAFNSYLRSQVISALLHGASALIVFALFGVNFGVVVAILFAALSVIPLVGIPIAVVIAAIVALISQPAVVLPVAIILLIIDQIIAYAIVPKLMSDSTGVPSLMAMLAIIIGVQLLGFWGLVFSVPIVGSAYAIFFDIVLPRRRKGQGLTDTPDVIVATESHVVTPASAARKPTQPEIRLPNT
jgi:predicted PurR-regulated permease PerM